MINRFWLKIQQIINNLFPRKRVQQHLARQVMTYWCEEDILVHEVARLKGLHPVNSAPSAFYEFDLLTAETSEVMTGVNELNVNEPDGPYFDLLGRLVKNPTPGIYIHNGRKVIVR